jgi:tRNA nucleotidyltransferase/poly(A) polymerase
MKAGTRRGPDMELVGEIARMLLSRGATGYLVGGAVRDSLLGRRVDDIDISVGGIGPARVAAFLHSRHGFTRPVAFKRFSTAFTRRGRTQVEISSLRGQVPGDVLGRDFTVNCLYVRLSPRLAGIRRERVLDPTGKGLSDLDRGLLRAYPDCYTPLTEDPLRLLRALRFRATHGFKIEACLKQAIGRTAYLISRAAPERVRVEIERILLSPKAASSFRIMQQTGLLEMVFPEVAATAGFEQGSPHHAYDLLTHTLKAVSYVRPDLRLRLAALLHDTGKIGARRLKGRRWVYYGHENLSAVQARDALLRLRFPGDVIDDVVFLIENHMVNYAPAWTDAAVRRFMRRTGNILPALLDLAAADRRAHAPETRMGTPVDQLRARLSRVTEQMESRAVTFEAPLDGRQIMRVLGIGEGPEVGRAKEYLCQVVLRRGRPLSKTEAERLLREWATRGPGPASK